MTRDSPGKISIADLLSTLSTRKKDEFAKLKKTAGYTIDKNLKMSIITQNSEAPMGFNEVLRCINSSGRKKEIEDQMLLIEKRNPRRVSNLTKQMLTILAFNGYPNYSTKILKRGTYLSLCSAMSKNNEFPDIRRIVNQSIDDDLGGFRIGLGKCELVVDFFSVHRMQTNEKEIATKCMIIPESGQSTKIYCQHMMLKENDLPEATITSLMDRVSTDTVKISDLFEIPLIDVDGLTDENINDIERKGGHVIFKYPPRKTETKTVLSHLWMTQNILGGDFRKVGSEWDADWED